MSEAAATPQPVLADVEDFLAWVQGRRERYEFVGGRLVMMAGGSEDHNDIQVNLLAALKRRLRDGRCKPNGSDLLVRIDERTRPFPRRQRDLRPRRRQLRHCAGRDFRDPLVRHRACGPHGQATRLSAPDEPPSLRADCPEHASGRGLQSNQARLAVRGARCGIDRGLQAALEQRQLVGQHEDLDVASLERLRHVPHFRAVQRCRLEVPRQTGQAVGRDPAAETVRDERELVDVEARGEARGVGRTQLLLVGQACQSVLSAQHRVCPMVV
jgi:hypothetical protein